MAHANSIKAGISRRTFVSVTFDVPARYNKKRLERHVQQLLEKIAGEENVFIKVQTMEVVKASAQKGL